MLPKFRCKALGTIAFKAIQTKGRRSHYRLHCRPLAFMFVRHNFTDQVAGNQIPGDGKEDVHAHGAAGYGCRQHMDGDDQEDGQGAKGLDVGAEGGHDGRCPRRPGVWALHSWWLSGRGTLHGCVYRIPTRPSNRCPNSCDERF